jgi:hypothetical protein
MKASRKIGVLILIILIVIQFIQPTKNISEEGVIGANDISKVHPISDEVHNILVKKCYDCHSNNTNYPWYFNVQPIGWWLAAHVHEGKENLNFSTFKQYPAKKANHALEEIGEVLEDGSMPLKAYTVLHEGTEITPSDKEAITSWLRSLNVK